MNASAVSQPILDQVTPILAVRDLARTIEWYTKCLGFAVNGTFGDPPVWCSLQRDRALLFFNQPPADAFPSDWPGNVPAKGHPPFPKPQPGNPTQQIRSLHIFYIHVVRLVEFRERLIANGLSPTEPRVTIYGMKEFELRDPDGYWLWFGEDTDEPTTMRE